MRVVVPSGLEEDLRDAADGRERLAAEALRHHTEQVVGRAELAGGVGGERQR